MKFKVRMFYHLQNLFWRFLSGGFVLGVFGLGDFCAVTKLIQLSTFSCVLSLELIKPRPQTGDFNWYCTFLTEQSLEYILEYTQVTETIIIVKTYISCYFCH